jgi:integrase
MTKALTTTAVNAAKPGSSRREVPDGGQPGLYLIVQATGAKSWALRYRAKGRPVKLTLGRWPAMTLAKARAAAAEAQEAADLGNDPAEAKRTAKAAKNSGRDAVRALIDQYDRSRLAHLRTGATVKRELDRFVVAAWGDRPVHEIAKRDVLDVLDGIAESGRGVTANRVRSYLSAFFGWCVERDVLAVSPMAGVRRVVPETSRDRVLSDDEARWLWRAADGMGLPWGPFAKALLLTGQRLGEVAGMREAELHGDVWHLPAARVKNKRPHTVPLSGAMLTLLAETDRIAGEGYVFTTTGDSALSNFHRGRELIASRMAEVAAKETSQPVEIPHWTFHDLRRTAATGMARLGIPVRVTEAVLNHVSGTGGGIVAVYQRHDYADEKREALEAWAQMVARIVDGTAGQVATIGGSR